MRATKAIDTAGNIYFAKGEHGSLVIASVIVGRQKTKTMLFKNYSSLHSFLDEKGLRQVGKGCLSVALKMGNAGNNFIYEVQ